VKKKLDYLFKQCYYTHDDLSSYLGEKMKVTNGQNVSVHYKGTLSDGTEFDNSRNRGETLDFQLGSGRLLVGFNDAIVGMSVGETKTVNLTADEAYGQPEEKAIQRVPKTAFADDFVFEEGSTVQGNGPAGPFIAKIKGVDDDAVTLDLNHPLAGKDLTFEVELVSVNSETDS
jgi:peptidylprolyl isomerase